MRPEPHASTSRWIALLLAPLLGCGASTDDPAGNGGAEPAAFLAFVRELAANAPGDVLRGTGADLLWKKELRSLGAGEFWGEAAQTASHAQKPERRDPLPAILDFHAQMQDAGIDWVFVPVPAKVAVDPTLVPAAPRCDGRVDVHHERFYALLAERGVPVLDLTPALRGLVADGERAHCRTDTHWSGIACARAAELVREHFGELAWLEALPKTEYRSARREVEIDGDMRQILADESVPKERLVLELVADEAGRPPETTKDSPILLLGDSHCLVFHAGGDMHAAGAGLADHLARAFGMPIDLVGVRGSGATPSRASVRRGDRLAGKKLVIWCLTVREFTEGQGWAKVPLRRT